MSDLPPLLAVLLTPFAPLSSRRITLRAAG